MKKFLSLMCVLALLVGMLAVGAVSASAAQDGQTALSVKSGDQVSYVLALGGVKDGVIGCDFSVYYDSSVFEVESVADFSNSTNRSDWRATINPNLDGEIRGNWSILDGVDFSDRRNFITANFKAKSAGTGHISYFIRYMFDESAFDDVQSKRQISTYSFTCDVKVNGEAVIENAAPELNIDEPQSSGNFINSRTGDSRDADPNDPDTIADEKPNGGSSNNNNNNNGNADNDAEIIDVTDADGKVIGTEVKNKSKNGSSSTDAADNKPGEKQGSVEVATDAQGNIIATSGSGDNPSADAGQQGGSSAALWIIIALILAAAAACCGYFVVKRRKSPDAAAEPADSSDPDDPNE